jgi:hypothetical protein
MKIRASAERLSSALEALSERLVEKMGEDAFKRHFPEIAELLDGGYSGAESGSPSGIYDGSGRFGFNGCL